MKSFTLLLLMFLAFSPVRSQNLVGFDAKSIKKYMKENYKNMMSEKVANPGFSYLKFSDNSDSQTLLFFLGSDSICKSERIMIDMRVKTDRVKEFNSIYRKHGELSWIDTRHGKDYLIELRDEPWYSVVTIMPHK